MHETLQLVFWLAIASIVYTYVGFPILVALIGKILSRKVRRGPIEPTVSLIIAAYNEEREIAARLRNAMQLDYPAKRLEVIVASDGSTDRTESIVAAFRDPRIRLLSLPRRGKLAALSQAVHHAYGDVLVFSDANSMYRRDALRALVRNFADPDVGGVAGHTAYRIDAKSESSSHGENLYWNYDAWLKELESDTGSIVSAHGGIYAIRRELFSPLPDPAVTDDFSISTGVIEKGKRLVFDADALAVETAVPSAAQEFRRRVRLMTRGLRSVLLRRRLLNPFRYGFYSLVLFTHKVLRRMIAFVLLGLLMSSLCLANDHWFYAMFAGAQCLTYGLAFTGWMIRGTATGRRKIFYVPFFYCFANLACALAWFNLFRGHRISVWQPQRHPAQTL